MTGVRVRDGDFEGKCEYCGEYLPLTAEFWPISRTRPQGVRRCRACTREYHRLHQRTYRGTLLQAVWRANQRAHYRALPVEERARRNASCRDWKAAHPERVRAYNQAYNKAYRERQRDTA